MLFRRAFRKLTRCFGLDFEQFLELSAAARTMHARLAILAEPRNQDPRRLLKFGHKVYSQNDEDGIIAEIFRRIGVQSKRFLEIGCGDGAENNTAALLLQGWTGSWVDGSRENERAVRERFGPLLANGKLRFTREFVTRDRIAALLAETQSGSQDLDLLSLDIDGNEFHLLQVMPEIARVIIVEYNSKFAPPIDWVMPYKADFSWNYTDYFGASLTALERMLGQKGYSLVGCNITGVNAFFVRQDLSREFLAPFTAENHYEPARYWLLPGFVSGYDSGVPFPLPENHSEG